MVYIINHSVTTVKRFNRTDKVIHRLLQQLILHKTAIEPSSLILDAGLHEAIISLSQWAAQNLP